MIVRQGGAHIFVAATPIAPNASRVPAATARELELALIELATNVQRDVLARVP